LTVCAATNLPSRPVAKKEDTEESADGGFGNAYSFDGNNYII
jgi:hypothetical protein